MLNFAARSHEKHRPLTRLLERMRAEHVAWRFKCCGPPASLGFGVNNSRMSALSFATHPAAELICIAIVLASTCDNDARAQEVSTNKSYYRLKSAAWESQRSQSPDLRARAANSRVQVQITSSTTNELLRKYDERVVAAVQRSCYLLESQSATRPTGAVIIDFELRLNGTISDLRHVQSSASKLTDTLCESAILLPSPFGNWPGSYAAGTNDHHKIRLVFSFPKEGR